MKIGIVGVMGSGKDTLASLLKRNYGFEQFAFGDAVKECAKQYFPKAFVNGVKPREVLQDVGNKFREIDEDVWINKTLHNIERNAYGGAIVISDVRYPNELNRLQEEGYIIIQIIVDREKLIERNKNRKGEDFKEEHLNHESERMAQQSLVGDICLYNNGTKEEFEQLALLKISEFLKSPEGRRALWKQHTV